MGIPDIYILQKKQQLVLLGQDKKKLGEIDLTGFYEQHIKQLLEKMQPLTSQ